MIKSIKNKKEIMFILDNLRREDRQELIALWGKNWKSFALTSIEDKGGLVLYGKNYSDELVPIAIGGFYDLSNKEASIACVWLLSSVFIYNNRHYFMKTLRDEILKASKKYDILYNYIYKTNHEAKLWLQKLGFCFKNPNPILINPQDGFEFFYKCT